MSSKVPKIISIINWKGGVGKTTFSHHIATGIIEIYEDIIALEKHYFNNKLPKILLIDLDPQCNLSIACLGEDQFENMVFGKKNKVPTIQCLFEHYFQNSLNSIDVNNFIQKKVVKANKQADVYPSIDLLLAHPELIYTDMNIATYSRANFKNALIGSEIYKFQILRDILQKIKSNYDFIIIDCPPNLNYVTQNALYESSFFLVPAILDKLSSYGILSIHNKVKDLNSVFSHACGGSYHKTELLGIVANQVREYSHLPKESQSNVLLRLKSLFGNKVFTNYLTYGDGIARASEQGLPVYALEAEHANAAKQSSLLKAIIREFIEKIY